MTRPEPRWLDRPDQWDALTYALLGCDVVGLDTEFYGADLSRTSHETCAHRARVHVWSVGLPTGRLNPRGYIEYCSAVLPAAALAFPGLHRWLTSPRRKVCHNAPVDRHAIENEWRELGCPGQVGGVVDTLGRSRWCHPGRVAPGPGFDLDSLGRDLLGRGKVASFEDLLSEPNDVQVERRETTHATRCECGTVPCRKPSKIPGHTRHKETTVRRWTETVIRGTRLIPLESVVPGHPRHPSLVKYAGVDAELAPELLQVLREPTREVPW